MHSALLYALVGEPKETSIDSHLGNGFPAIDAETIQYLDGHTLCHGQAVAQVEEQRQQPIVDDEGIWTESAWQSRRVLTNWYADLEAGWAGIDTSDGEFFFKMLAATHAVSSEKMEIGLEAWARDFLQNDSAYCWGLSYSEGDDEDAIRAGAGFHQDASLEQLDANKQDVSAIGFGYEWADARARGIICESGYVAIYRDWTEELFGRWLSDQVLPYTVYDADSVNQETLGDTEECDRCERETELHDYDDGRYCAVCIDFFEDDETGDGEFANLDTVSVSEEADGDD
jgi:hypothetical protein